MPDNAAPTKADTTESDGRVQVRALLYIVLTSRLIHGALAIQPETTVVKGAPLELNSSCGLRFFKVGYYNVALLSTNDFNTLYVPEPRPPLPEARVQALESRFHDQSSRGKRCPQLR